MFAGRWTTYSGPVLVVLGLLLFSVQPVAAGQHDGSGESLAVAGQSDPESQTPPGSEEAARAQILNSDAMLDALIWWDDYFATAAGDHEKEREELASRLANMSSRELRMFLLKFQQDRERAKQRQTAFEQGRRQLSDMYLAQRRAEAQARPSRPRYSDSPGFGRATRYPPRRYPVVRPPLITSLDVARWTVYRSVFGRRW